MTAGGHTISPEEAAQRHEQLLTVLNAERANFEVFAEHDRIKNRAWAEEIALLRRRVETHYEMLELPGGDAIAIRTCLTEAEETRMSELFVRIFGKHDENAPYELIELCTANPEITVTWLKENPDAFAVQDLLDVLYGYIERKQALRQEAADRVTRIIGFRIQREGERPS